MWYIKHLDEKTGETYRQDITDIADWLPTNQQLELAHQATVLVQANNYPCVKISLWYIRPDNNHHVRYSEFYGSQKRIRQ